jgi:hypothetical protein
MSTKRFLLLIIAALPLVLAAGAVQVIGIILTLTGILVYQLRCSSKTAGVRPGFER